MRRRHRLLTAVLVAGALLAEPAGAAWRMPVGGEVVRGFEYRRAAPFERGAHRNIQITGRPGQRVRAACGGEVTHAGVVPHRGLGVSVRCGSLVATHLGLASTRVAVGSQVRGGARIGEMAGARLTLGARRANDRWGYIDPRRLLRSPEPDLGPAPLVRPARWQIRAAPRRSPAPAPRPPGLDRPPVVAWIGLGVAALALGGATVRTVRWSVRDTRPVRSHSSRGVRSPPGA